MAMSTPTNGFGPPCRVARLPDWPAAMPLYLAAAYCGLSVTVFIKVCPVKPIAFTKSSRGNRYLRRRLDQWLVELDTNASRPKRRMVDLLTP